MNSRLVLGAANYGRMTQREVNQLLETALTCGISRVDTAHGYEESEERIGNFLRSGIHFDINTKVGLPNPEVFTPSGIKLSVEESLKRLGIESLRNAFCSLPPC